MSDEQANLQSERSFGVRAACCRFLFRKLACGTARTLSRQATKGRNFTSASKLADQKAAASCTHSKKAAEVE